MSAVPDPVFVGAPIPLLEQTLDGPDIDLVVIFRRTPYGEKVSTYILHGIAAADAAAFLRAHADAVERDGRR